MMIYDDDDGDDDGDGDGDDGVGDDDGEDAFGLDLQMYRAEEYTMSIISTEHKSWCEQCLK